MHFGLICNEYPPARHGGIGSSNHDLTEGLLDAGHRVTVLGVYPPANLPATETHAVQRGLTVVRLRESSGWCGHKAQALWNRWRLRRRLAALHSRDVFDLVETSDFGGWLPWGGAGGAPVISRLQGTNVLFDRELGRAGDAFEYGLERRSLARADFWIGISAYALRATLEVCNLDDKPSTVIHHAVDTDFFSPSPAGVSEPGLVVFVNRITPRKGVPQLMNAANLVCASRPEARFVLIGRDTKTSGPVPYHEELLNLVRPEFRPRITFTGRLPRDEVLPWIRRASVCCYPSHCETFGIAPIEAMAVGRAAIYFQRGPGPEVIEDGVSGLLCDSHDPKDIADKIVTVLKNPTLAATLGQNARQRVLKLFDKKDWITRNVKFFESCLKH